MGRYRGSICRLCRREGVKLFLKGTRCVGPHCSFDRREYAPGQHGQRRGKISDYGLQLREKQKTKRIYGLGEKQFRCYFAKAARQSGVTGYNLLLLLERRLDNMVYRMGFGNTRTQARQLVRHKHFLVNGKSVNIPSYLVKVGDKVSVREKSKELLPITASVEYVKQQKVPEWLDVDFRALEGKVDKFPLRKEITIPVNEQLIVELYSK
ncbi:MAG: 30S ribosomal protein S4 [bacterium]